MVQRLVLWLLLQPQFPGLQLPCSLGSLDYRCPRSFISLHFRCIMAAPAASALWTTAALWLLLASFPMYYGSSCSLSYLDYSCPAASVPWITASLAASFRFISDVLWLLLQLQLSNLQLPCNFSSLDYSCPAASFRFISDVLWLPLQLHFASFQMYYGCSLSVLDYSCPRSFISLHF